MTSGGVSIRRCKDVPHISCRYGARDNWLNRKRDGSNDSAIEKSILTSPRSQIWIGRVVAIYNDRGWRSRCFKELVEFVAFKESPDLSAPHDVIEMREFRYVGHIDRDQRCRRIVSIVDNRVLCRGMSVISRHIVNKEKQRKKKMERRGREEKTREKKKKRKEKIFDRYCSDTILRYELNIYY